MPVSPCVYLSNLDYAVTSDGIEEAFEEQGIHVKSFEFLKKGVRGRPGIQTGLAVAYLETNGDVDKSLAVMDGKPVNGRPMIVRKNKFEEDKLDYKPITSA